MNNVAKVSQPPLYWDRLFAPSSALAMITTVDADGRPNIASYGTCTRVNHKPVSIAFTTLLHKDTGQNVLATGEFTVNLPPFDREILEKVRICGLAFDHGVNEFEKAGLTPLPALALKPPRIVECNRHFECKVEWTQAWTEEGRLMVCGALVAASVDADCVDEEGYLIWDVAKPAHYCGGPYGGTFVAAYETMAVDLPYDGPEVFAADTLHQKMYDEL